MPWPAPVTGDSGWLIRRATPSSPGPDSSTTPSGTESRRDWRSGASSTANGHLTRQGRAVRDQVEDRTNEMARAAFDALDDRQLDELLGALLPVARAVIAAGDIPEITPVGQRFRL